MEFQKKISSSYCVKEMKPCIKWVDTYFKDCLCNTKDEVSFGLGFLSLILWAVAEIPQILSNFKAESSHGISLAFLVAWVLGDVFNLLGCILEPATLPTQLYTAALYTATTAILVLQSVYYDYLRKLLHIQEQQSEPEVEELKKPLKSHKPADSAIAIPRKEAYYYASARSMVGSFTPPFRSNLWPVRSGPSALVLQNDSSSDEDDDDQDNEIPSRSTVSRPKPIPRSAGIGAFIGSSMSMPGKTKALMYAGFASRKLLQEHGSGSVTGQWLGWMMAAIYMGGRLPQIYLNIKRGSVEGLNPLMFIFAVTANSTYVASIVVRTIEWDKIKANLPWLLDAVVCVLLDLSIIMQYVYYKYIRGKRVEDSSMRRKP